MRNSDVLQQFEDYLQGERGYSVHTLRAYINRMTLFG